MRTTANRKRMGTASGAPPVLWRCPPDRLASSSLAAYARWIGEPDPVGPDEYNALWAWSVAELEPFWESIWQYFEVCARTPYSTVLDSREMPGAHWFPGATLNFAEHCFRRHEDTEIAIVHDSELRGMGEWSWGELRDRTAAIASGLRALGIEPGDRVAAYLPNIPETIAAFLACASIGAIWSSCSPDFGAPAVLDRFRQIEPRVLLAVDGYRYGGRDFDRMPVVAELRAALPSVQATVILDYLARTDPPSGTIGWSQLERLGEPELTFSSLAFDHPLWILYSSGTTGLPKPIVHGHGGVLLELLKLQHLHHDLREGDRFFWFTTTGWVMWNIVVSALLTSAAVVLYDGSPVHPDPDRLWRLASDARITCFGASAAFLTACVEARMAPLRDGETDIRSIGSTGSPLPAEAFRWVYEQFPPEVWLFSVSGGTDVSAAFVGGALSMPVYEGEISARMLGVSVESWDDAGHALIDRTGELVVTAPMPSMPLFLWGDQAGDRLRKSYFSTYPGVWRHGDFIEITSRGTAIIRGRSDSTINRGGVRMGTSEIYRAVLSIDDVVEAVAVDIAPPEKLGSLELFVVLSEGTILNDELKRRITERIRSYCSPRHIPDEIVQMPQAPRTISGKLIELPIKRILMGEPPELVVSSGSLADPESLEWFIRYSAKRRAALREQAESVDSLSATS